MKIFFKKIIIFILFSHYKIVKSQTIDTTIFCNIIEMGSDEKYNFYLCIIESKKSTLCLYLTGNNTFEYSENYSMGCVDSINKKFLILLSRPEYCMDGLPYKFRFIEKGDLFFCKFKIPREKINNMQTKEFEFYYTFNLKGRKWYCNLKRLLFPYRYQKHLSSSTYRKNF